MMLCNAFLGNGSANTNTNTTIGLLLETVFSARPVQSGCKEDKWGNPIIFSVVSPVEFCTGSCEDKAWTRDAAESTLLEAVAGEQLMKAKLERA
jgi:hypothetical protein